MVPPVADHSTVATELDPSSWTAEAANCIAVPALMLVMEGATIN